MRQQRRLVRTICVAVVLTAVLINILHPVYVDHGPDGAPWNLARHVSLPVWSLMTLAISGMCLWVVANVKLDRTEVVSSALIASAGLANLLSLWTSGGVSNPIHLISFAGWRIQISVGDLSYLIGMGLSWMMIIFDGIFRRQVQALARYLGFVGEQPQQRPDLGNGESIERVSSVNQLCTSGARYRDSTTRG